MLPGSNVRIEQLRSSWPSSSLAQYWIWFLARMILTKWWLIAHVDIDGHLNFGSRNEPLFLKSLIVCEDRERRICFEENCVCLVWKLVVIALMDYYVDNRISCNTQLEICLLLMICLYSLFDLKIKKQR